MKSLTSAEKLSVEKLPMSVLATKASVLASLGQFDKSLSVAELILSEERQHCLALSVKADSLFNLCMFEDALVMYHRLILYHYNQHNMTSPEVGDWQSGVTTGWRRESITVRRRSTVC